MKKTWVKRFSSFKKAAKADQEYYAKLTPSERLETIQFLRESYFKLKGLFKNDGRSRLRRSIKIIQQA